MRQPRITRIFTYALLASLPLLMANCGGKGGDGAVTPNSIEGNWKITVMKLSPGVEVGPPIGKVTDLLTFFNLFTQSTCLTDITFTFKNDGTMTSDNPKSCQASAGTIEDQSGIDVTGTSKWSLTGDQLTITDSDGSKQVFTSKINGNTMTWTFQEDYEDASGKTTKQDVTFEYRRI